MNYTERKRELLKSIEIIDKRLPSGIPYQVFDDIPNKLKMTEEQIGKRVWIASMPRTTKAYLKEFDGNEVLIRFRTGVDRDFFVEEVILHPTEWKGYV